VDAIPSIGVSLFLYAVKIDCMSISITPNLCSAWKSAVGTCSPAPGAVN
jgi:hypothetical protein